MTRLGLSPAATALFRALIAHAAVPRERILLSDWRSVDWQSLTFIGERHEIALRICAPQSEEAAKLFAQGLAAAEFNIPGQIVADIAIDGTPEVHPDGSTSLRIEALTIASD